MNVYMICLWVLGVCLVVGGTTMLVLTLATKLFYTNITSIKAGADFSAGQAIAALALVTWDETTIRADEAGNFIKWKSTTQFQDSATSPLYTYDLLPCAYVSGVLPTSNIPATNSDVFVKLGNNGGLGVTTTTNTYIGNLPQTDQQWVSFPHLRDPRTVVVVGSGPVEGTGVGFSHRIRCVDCGTGYFGLCEMLLELDFNTAMTIYGDNALPSSKRSSRPLQAGVDYSVYTDASNTQISSNCVAYTYTGSWSNSNRYIAAYLNGNIVQLKNLDQFGTTYVYSNTTYVTTSFITASAKFQPYVGVGDMNKNSTVYAILVFNRVLTPVELQSLSLPAGEVFGSGDGVPDGNNGRDKCGDNGGEW